MLAVIFFFFFTEGNVEESLDLHEAADKTTLYNSYKHKIQLIHCYGPKAAGKALCTVSLIFFSRQWVYALDRGLFPFDFM